MAEPFQNNRLDGYRSELQTLGSSRRTRLAYAAAHIVLTESYAACSHSLSATGSPEEIAPHIDWAKTMAFRTHLDSLGFGIAEAMDTAQRFYLGWDIALDLIRRCGTLKLNNGFIAGAGIDHIGPDPTDTEIVDGVVYQGEEIQKAGGQVILLPIIPLALNKRSESDYVALYQTIINELEGPLFIHWLGEMFLPALRGYFPGESFRRIMELDPAKVRGVKLSLLDAQLELDVRRSLLPRDQIVLTGDDFHFAGLIHGKNEEAPPPVERWTEIAGRPVALGAFSHALLGILDGIATPAALALDLLAHDQSSSYFDIMRPCEALGQWIFQAPTPHYKAGLAYLAFLNGHQDNFQLVNHEERARDRQHFEECARLADHAGVFPDAALASQRQQAFWAS